MFKYFYSFVLVFSFVISAEASDISGKWEGSIKGQNGDIKIMFTFFVQGTEITGSVKSEVGELQINNGIIDGDFFSFEVEVDGMIIFHECVINGQIITMKYNGMNGDDTLTLYRVKE